MAPLCLVRATDYRRYWGEDATADSCPAIVWNGVDRRTAVADRRSQAHDRRWDTCRGRRVRLADRRRRI